MAAVGNLIPPLHVVLKNNHPADATDDAYLALPTTRLGSRYRGLCYPGASSGRFARWAIAADEAMPAGLDYADCVGGGETSPALSPGDSYQFLCDNRPEDCTGILVDSSDGAAFAFVSGSTCAFVPPGSPACDTLLEMIPPDDPAAPWAGSEYLTTEFNKKTQQTPFGDVYRIVALEAVSLTEIVVASGGAVNPEGGAGHPCTIPASGSPTLLAAGEYCDVSIGGATSGTHAGGRITSSGGRFLVGQYSKGGSLTESGDASLMLVIPATRFRCSHRFFSFSDFDFHDPDPNGNVNGSYVNIVAPSASIGAVLLDGGAISLNPDCSAPQALPGSAYSWVMCRLPNPCTQAIGCKWSSPPPACPPSCPYGDEHTVTHTDGIGVYVYGQRFFGAYSYPAGMAFPQ